MPAFTLSRCSAIITGASSGLGAEFARQLAPHATTLCLVARREAELERTRSQVQALNPNLKVHLVVADVADEASRQSILTYADQHALLPNLLINNAGVGDYGSFATASADRLAAQIHVNITGLVMLTHLLLPRLQKPAGILNVSSLAGTLFMPDLAVYAASKAFVTSFTEALHIELASQGVSVCAVCPGPTPTNFGKNSRRESGEDTNRSGQGLLRQPPEKVVAGGLQALVSGSSTTYPGLPVAMGAALFRIMPRSVLRWIMSRRASGA